MPGAINTLHILLTLIAFGILIGLGWALVHMAVQWPGSQLSWAAAIICVLLVVLAWVV